MAISFHTGAVKDDANTAGASQTITIPAGVSAGDVILFVVTGWSSTGATEVIQASSTGTTPAIIGTTQSVTFSSSNLQAAIFVIVATASDPGAVITTSFVSGDSAKWTIALGAWSGASNARPVDVSGATTNSGNGSSITCPAVTSHAGGDWAIQLVGCALGGSAFTGGGGYTQRESDVNASSGGGAFIYDGNAALGPAGSSAGGATFSNAGNNSWWAGFTVGLAAFAPIVPPPAAYPHAPAPLTGRFGPGAPFELPATVSTTFVAPAPPPITTPLSGVWPLPPAPFAPLSRSFGPAAPFALPETFSPALTPVQVPLSGVWPNVPGYNPALTAKFGPTSAFDLPETYSPGPIQPFGNPSGGPWVLDFQDDFTTAYQGFGSQGAPNPAVWYDHLIDGNRFNLGNATETEWYPHSKAGLSVASSVLTLTARFEDPTNPASFGYDPACPPVFNHGQTPSFTSGFVCSKPGFAASYGFWEARVQAPDGGGSANAWPAVWMVAADALWPPEIDIFEWFSANGHGGYFNDSGTKVLDVTYTGDGNWHTWGMRWTTTDVTLFRDGVSWGTYTAAGPTTRPMIFYLQLAAQFSTGTGFPCAVNVDYVRHWSVQGSPVQPAPVSISPVNGIPSSGSVTVSFDASPYPGGTTYRVTACPVDARADNAYPSAHLFFTGSSSPITATGLNNGARYTFTLSAFNGTYYSIESLPVPSLAGGPAIASPSTLPPIPPLDFDPLTRVFGPASPFEVGTYAPSLPAAAPPPPGFIQPAGRFWPRWPAQRRGTVALPGTGGVPQPPIPPVSVRDVRREPRGLVRGSAATPWQGSGVSQPPIPPSAAHAARRPVRLPPRSGYADTPGSTPQPAVPPQALRDTRREPRVPPRSNIAGWQAGISQPPVPPAAVRAARRPWLRKGSAASGLTVTFPPSGPFAPGARPSRLRPVRLPSHQAVSPPSAGFTPPAAARSPQPAMARRLAAALLVRRGSARPFEQGVSQPPLPPILAAPRRRPLPRRAATAGVHAVPPPQLPPVLARPRPVLAMLMPRWRRQATWVPAQVPPAPPAPRVWRPRWWRPLAGRRGAIWAPVPPPVPPPALQNAVSAPAVALTDTSSAAVKQAGGTAAAVSQGDPSAPGVSGG